MSHWCFGVLRVCLFPAVESLGHKADPVFISEDPPHYFPQRLHQSAFPPAVHKVPQVSRLAGLLDPLSPVRYGGLLLPG